VRGLHGAQPDLHRLELLLHHEGVGLDGPSGARAAQGIVQPIEQVGPDPGREDLARHH
jgi:hypothetical protein